jgi:hypothetical protein
VNDHPTQAELEGLAWNRVSAGRAHAIVAHIVRGCPQCRASLSPHFAGLLGLADPPAPEREARAEKEYDLSVGRAFVTVLARARELREAKGREAAAPLATSSGAELSEAGAENALQGVPAFESLLQRSWALRHESPLEMVRLARQARDLAESFASEELGATALANLQCRAWVELANANRVADDLAAGERALGRATELFLQGTQDEELAARLFSVQASLLGDCRRFSLADTALDLVLSIHRRRGDDHQTGRALVKKGIFAGYQGKSEEAVLLIEEGLTLLDEKREPRLVHLALHNQARLLLDAGQLREARIALWKAKARGLDPGGQVNELKVRWLEGQINAALNELERAEAALSEVKEGFEEAGLIYKAALVGLELGAVLLRQERPEPAAREILTAADIFMALGIGREASASVLLLRHAAEQRIVDSGLIEYVAGLLRRAEGATALEAREE